MCSIGANGLFWTVRNDGLLDGIDLPRLDSIQCDEDAFWFNDNDDSTLILKSTEWRG